MDFHLILQRSQKTLLILLSFASQISFVYTAVYFRHWHLPILALGIVVLRFFEPKRLLRVSCISRCQFGKCSSIVKNLTDVGGITLEGLPLKKKKIVLDIIMS